MALIPSTLQPRLVALRAYERNPKRHWSVCALRRGGPAPREVRHDAVVRNVSFHSSPFKDRGSARRSRALLC
jgi:hypothetical protein